MVKIKGLSKIINEKKQKDWIVSCFETGKLFCITINYENGNWCLTEFVSFFQLPSDEMKKMVDMGYMTMLDAMNQFSNSYTYIIAKHSFSKNDLGNYWKSLVPNIDGKHSFEMGKIEIDKSKFEKEIIKLVKKSDISYSKGKD